MAHDLEYPGADGVPDWGSLYRARGDEVVRHRLVFTGDVFEKVPVQGLGESKTKTVIVHCSTHAPCGPTESICTPGSWLLSSATTRSSPLRTGPGT